MDQNPDLCCVPLKATAFTTLSWQPAEALAEQAELAKRGPVTPLPPGASKRLPDGRVLMNDGSIQRAPPA